MESGASGSTAENEGMSPVARMMMNVAGHAILSYVQFRALAELLIQKGVFTREELEGQFSQMREVGVQRAIDEWFEPDIAYHLKMAMASDTAAGSAGTETSAEGAPSGVVVPEADEIARARAMQSGE